MRRIFLEPVGLHSRAMVRIKDALRENLPKDFSVESEEDSADLVVIYVIGENQRARGLRALARGADYAVVQCCLRTAGLSDLEEWHDFWDGAAAVWSYYDLNLFAGYDGDFLYAPLGLDEPFRGQPFKGIQREPLVVTSGYVCGPGAEAIEEVWAAASAAGIKAVHFGPGTVDGMEQPDEWESLTGISDEELAALYSRASWVSGLRYVEGFELPAAEGLACGARPILFDQPATRRWYGRHAVYVPERSGDELVGYLTNIFSGGPKPVSRDERAAVLARFDWEPSCSKFLRRATASLQEVAA